MFHSTFHRRDRSAEHRCIKIRRRFAQLGEQGLFIGKRMPIAANEAQAQGSREAGAEKTGKHAKHS